MIKIAKKLYIQSLAQFNKKVFNTFIKQKDFCIFSNDCWGGELYRWMELPYNTPFIGLMLMAPCYINFLKNPKKYLEANFEFINQSKYPALNEFRSKTKSYPIGKLLDIEIHFLHYKTEEEATDKWNRRKQRINWNNLFIKFTADTDYATEYLVAEFDKLSYKKVCFSKIDYPKYASCTKIPNFAEDGAEMFKLCAKKFDVIAWINNKDYRKNRVAKLRSKLLYFTLKRYPNPNK